MARFEAKVTADQLLSQTNRISFAAFTSRRALNMPKITAKDKIMGVFTTIARNLFVCLSFFFLITLTVTSRPVLAQGQPQNQKPTVSYDEKKRQANDIAVTV